MSNLNFTNAPISTRQQPTNVVSSYARTCTANLRGFGPSLASSCIAEWVNESIVQPPTCKKKKQPTSGTLQRSKPNFQSIRRSAGWLAWLENQVSASAVGGRRGAVTPFKTRNRERHCSRQSAMNATRGCLEKLRESILTIG